MTATVASIARQDQVREDLALAYRIFSHLGWDDLTYTHLSARIPGKEAFLIQPLGLFFDEVRPEDLIEISFDGEVLDQKNKVFNHTGYVIHGSIYKARPDINASFHLHTIDGVAVSAMEEGLLPVNQFALHFYNRISYHDYASLALDIQAQGGKLASDLGQNKAMILRNHGTITCGATIHEAYLYANFLEKACQAQVRSMASKQPLITPPHEICERAARDLREFEPDFGARDWAAWKRKLTPVK